MQNRERLSALGPGALSEEELLSLLLGCGTRQAPASAVAAELLAEGLSGLRRTPVALLAGRRGIGPAQACRIAAALELGRRAVVAPQPARRRLDQPRALLLRLWAGLAFLRHEEFWVLLLNARCEELCAVRVSQGGLSHCSVLPREALAPALLHGAPLCAFAHNHPSGDPRPSPDDLRLELLLEEAGRTLGLTVVDHLVVAEGGAHSARAGLLSRPAPEELEMEVRDGRG
jgi:DNA repair protein RadC